MNSIKIKVHSIRIKMRTIKIKMYSIKIKMYSIKLENSINLTKTISMKGKKTIVVPCQDTHVTKIQYATANVSHFIALQQGIQCQIFSLHIATSNVFLAVDVRALYIYSAKKNTRLKDTHFIRIQNYRDSIRECHRIPSLKI